MIFEYQLIDVGLAEVYFAHGPRSIRFKEVNNWSDALGDLVGGLIELIEGYKWHDVPADVSPERTLVERSDIVELMWYSDPAGWKWSMELYHDLKLDIRVRYFDDVYAEGADGWEMVSVTTHLIELLTEVIRSMDDILRKYGIIQYKETWGQHDFPLARYLILCRFLSTASLYQITKEQQAELKVSSLHEELQRLNKLVGT